MTIVIRLKLCSIWDVMHVPNGAFGLGSFWSIDACYELSLFFQTMNLTKTCWNMKIVHRWDWQLACVGLVEIPYAIIYILGCYVSCLESFTCLDNFSCAKTWQSSYVMRKDRDGSILSYVKVSRRLPIAHLDELEPCSGCQNHCLKLLIVYDIGLAWLLS